MMRTGLALLIVSTLAACGSDSNGGGDDDPLPDSGIEPPARGFQVESPEIEILPGQEITYCYYFRTPNTEPMAIKKWVSEMTPGSHHMIMFTTANTQGQPVDSMPPGTISSTNCGFGGGTSIIPSWIYAAQTPTSELNLPADDGAGMPVAMEIAANSAAFFQMHYFNATDAPLRAKVTLNAEALDAGVAFTRTAAYITYNNSISIPPDTEGHVETQSCSVPAGKKFWLMSTHAHKQAVNTEVKDGSKMAFQSTDWEHPGAEMWMASPFFTFASNQITYSCTYNNSSTREINSGDSAATDEMCMATGYFFPATKPLICFDGLGPF